MQPSTKTYATVPPYRTEEIRRILKMNFADFGRALGKSSTYYPPREIPKTLEMAAETLLRHTKEDLDEQRMIISLKGGKVTQVKFIDSSISEVSINHILYWLIPQK